MEHNRKSNESLEAYRIRLCKIKDDEDLRWIDLSDIWKKEVGEYKSPDWFRKFYRYYSQGYTDALQDNIQSDEVLDELELKKIELLEERKKLQVIRNQYNKIATEKARKDLLFENVKESFNKLDVIDPVVDLSSFGNVQQASILSFGDIHFGKKFESLHNTYNEEIAMNRMNEIIADTVKYLDKHDIVDLDVINLADSIEGMMLRTSQLQSLQSGFTDQVIKFSKFYAKWIRELSRYVRVNLHHISSSNHTELRPHNSGRGEYPAEDMERIIGMYIQDVLEGHSNININLYEDGIAEFELLGYNFVGLHGHQLKNKKSAIKDLSMQRRKFYDYCFLGHWHSGETYNVGEGVTNNIQIIQTPSVMGADKYADSLFLGGKAGALITTFTHGKGLTDMHNIILN